jgi:hypothetical protein
MGFSADKDAPFFFTKSPWAVCQSAATMPIMPARWAPTRRASRRSTSPSRPAR